MFTQTYTLDGQEVSIHYLDSNADLDAFDEFLSRGDKVLGLDTETTGLDIYSPTFECRTVQFGNRDEAYVLRVDLFAGSIIRALRQPRFFTVHNAAFDLQVIDKTLGVTIEELGPRVFDTRIFAHLMDPRQRHEGGTGLGLKDLSEIYVAPDAPDTSKDLYEVFRREYKATKVTGWRVIDIDHPVYVLYAGLDPILARRLFDELSVFVKAAGFNALSQFEHHLQVLLAIMQRRGIKVDVPYVEDLRRRLAEEAEAFRAVAARYGVENIGSTKQVAEVLEAMGEELTARTPSGALKVDKGVLTVLADLDLQWNRVDVREPNPVADAVLRAKRAEKWGESYVSAFLNLRDADDRLHPVIGGLQARTARMSISTPPLQQLPSSDWTIRRGLVADPGQLIIAADYDAVEMRVLAGLADETTMKKAINDGVDLHSFTAEAIWGPDFTPKHRKIGKGVGFGKVYGGGAATLSLQTGAPLAEVKHAIKLYDQTFPGIERFARNLQRQANYGKREVVTPSGRHLPLDRQRLYAATNYVVQSTARDLLAQAIVDLFAAGLGEHLLLPVHDEIIGQAPAADAEDVIREVSRIMETDNFYGVPISSSFEVYGPTWGHGYGAPV